MARPLRALLSVRALKANLAAVREYAPRARVLAIVKTNAYGHGLLWSARVLEDADGFGVVSVEEGLALRRAGERRPIVLLEGCFSRDEQPVSARNDLTPVLHHDSQLSWLLETPEAGSAWLKVDTGMHRLGFTPERAPEVARLLTERGIHPVWMSHLCCADELPEVTHKQIERFNSLSHHIDDKYKSIANSAGIIGHPHAHLGWVRPGIMLYGSSPFRAHTAVDLGLKAVMTLESELISVNMRRRGDTVGYGGAFLCPEDMPVGVVAGGYGDGYPRHAPSGTPVLVNGRRCTVAGRVSMDMISVDLRAAPDARPGDPVVLWGRGLPVDEIAQAAGTIAYELLCQVARRVPRLEEE